MELKLNQLSALEQFSCFFQKEHIEQLARKTGFIRRSSSRLSGEAFLKMLVANVLPDTEWSLNDQCDYLEAHHGIAMAKQSLDERYTAESVALLKQCFQAVLRHSLSSSMEGIQTCFTEIHITDSTSFQLPAPLAAFYQSNGGSTSGSSVKIHLTLELLKFQAQDFVITDGKSNDANYWKQKGWTLNQGSLWLADLGYFSWKTLAEIAASGNYFLSRYKTGTTLYIKNKTGGYEELDIEKQVKKNKQGKLQAIEVYFGEQKTKGRLIVEKVPDQVRKGRLQKCQKAHANLSKKGKQWNISATKKLLCGYNLYITNAPASKLPTKDVFLIYGLRWQIELMFKIWKSLLFIDKIGPMNIFRFECFLYGRLLFVLLSMELMAFIKSALRDEEIDVEISEWKTMKLIKKNSER